MSGQPADSHALLVDAGATHDVFDVVEITDRHLRVRTAFLFELGEELRVRFEQNGARFEATARVLAHIGTGPDRVTELELADRTTLP
jgi:hypothetical protein